MDMVSQLHLVNDHKGLRQYGKKLCEICREPMPRNKWGCKFHRGCKRKALIKQGLKYIRRYERVPSLKIKTSWGVQNYFAGFREYNKLLEAEFQRVRG